MDELRAAHGEELQRQSAAHVRLCDELQARAEADAVAAARLAAEAAASQQVRGHDRLLAARDAVDLHGKQACSQVASEACQM